MRFAYLMMHTVHDTVAFLAKEYAPMGFAKTA